MKILSVFDDRSKITELQRSLDYFNLDYELIFRQWKGFGSKLHGVYEYLREHIDCKEFMFVDAYDSFFVGVPEFKEIVSAEVNCWPDAELSNQYQNINFRFPYVNSGGYMMTRERFMTLFENDRPSEDCDDQRWLTKQVLNNNIPIDNNCDVFQTLCGVHQHEFELGTVNSKIYSTITKTFPAVLHGNGKAKMEYYYNLL